MQKFTKVFFYCLLFIFSFTLLSCSNKESVNSAAAKPATEASQNSVVKPDEEVFKVEVGTSVSRGPEDAAATIISFADFQCPFSKKSVDMIESIMRRYDGKVRYVFKHFPLSFHKEARQASFAAIAAQNQGKFWEYYAKLFEDIKKINEETLVSYAQELKLDMDKFNDDRISEETVRRVEQDIALGANFGVRGTPTIFVNGIRLVGANNGKLETVLAQQIVRGEQIKAKGIKDPYSELIKNGKTKFIPPKREPLPIASDVYKVEIPARAPIWGSKDALVTVVLIDDFECPFCARLHNTYEDL